jgi:hypothetical protein
MVYERKVYGAWCMSVCVYACMVCERMVYGVWCVWCMVCMVCMVYGVWCVWYVWCVWCMVCMVYGAYGVYGVWCTVCMAYGAPCAKEKQMVLTSPSLSQVQSTPLESPRFAQKTLPPTTNAVTPVQPAICVSSTHRLSTSTNAWVRIACMSASNWPSFAGLPRVESMSFIDLFREGGKGAGGGVESERGVSG